MPDMEVHRAGDHTGEQVAICQSTNMDIGFHIIQRSGKLKPTEVMSNLKETGMRHTLGYSGSTTGKPPKNQADQFICDSTDKTTQNKKCMLASQRE